MPALRRKIIRHPITGCRITPVAGAITVRPLARVGCVTGTQTIASFEAGTEETQLQFRRISPCIRGGRRLFVMEGSREQFFSPGLTPPAAWRPGGINPRASATPKGALRKILLLPPRKPVDLLHIKIRLQSRNLQPRRKGKSHVSITQ
jgi:hypothetical protein